jgi:hypothetical protein
VGAFEQERASGDAVRHGPGFSQWAGSGARDPRRKETIFFLFIFKSAAAQNPILSSKNSFSKSDSKMKVVLTFMIFNFAKRSKVKIPIDFELRI